MNKNGGTMRDQLAQRRCVGFVFVCLLVFALSCGREPGIIVNIAEWPTGVERIRVTTTIEGTVGTDIYVNRDQTRFVVRVPASSQGAVDLDATGLDLMGCKLATGNLTEPVPGNLNRFVERTLVLSPLSFHVCPFAPAVNFQLSQGLFSLAVGDFNNDATPDLAVANNNNSQVSVLLGKGNGDFGPPPLPVPASVSVGNKPISVAVGDFNGDAKSDLAVANYMDNSVSVLLGNGMGGFSPAPASPFSVGNAPDSVAVGDFNGDLKPDLAIASHGSNDVRVLLGDNKGGFSSAPNPFPVGIRPSSVAVGDFNGDLKPDLAIMNDGSNNVSILLGNSQGSLFGIAQNFDVGRYPVSVVVGDFNNDMKPDLAVLSAGDAAQLMAPNLMVLLGNGVGGFGPTSREPVSVQFSIPPRAVAVGDFNGDGKPDLAVTCADDKLEHNEVRVLLGNGAGGFGLGSVYPVGKNPASVAVGDFDGDGKTDIATANYTGGDVSILLNRF